MYGEGRLETFEEPRVSLLALPVQVSVYLLYQYKGCQFTCFTRLSGVG